MRIQQRTLVGTARPEYRSAFERPGAVDEHHPRVVGRLRRSRRAQIGAGRKSKQDSVVEIGEEAASVDDYVQGETEADYRTP